MSNRTQAAIDPRPDDADVLAAAYRVRAAAHVDSRHWDMAVADATAAIELEPDDVTTRAAAHVARAVAYATTNRLEEAFAGIDLEPNRASNLAWLHVIRGSAYSQLGRTDMASADANRALALTDDADAVRLAEGLLG